MSNYGPKGYDLYNEIDNISRKISRTGDSLDLGVNSQVRSYSTKPGQLSSKSSANRESARYQRLNKKQPTKSYRGFLESQGKTELEIQQILIALLKIA